MYPKQVPQRPRPGLVGASMSTAERHQLASNLTSASHHRNLASPPPVDLHPTYTIWVYTIPRPKIRGKWMQCAMMQVEGGEAP